MTIRPALELAWTAVGEVKVSVMPSLAAAPSGPLISAWVAMPVGAVVVVLLAVHMRALAVAEMPESRRRIRTANGWMMLLATPVTAYAFGLASPSDPRVFLLSWLAVAGLLAIVLFLAGIDILNTGRISLDDRQNLRQDLRDLGQGLQHGPPGGTPDSPRDGHV